MITNFLLTQNPQRSSHQSIDDSVASIFSFDSLSISFSSFSVACKQASKSKRFLKRS